MLTTILCPPPRPYGLTRWTILLSFCVHDVYIPYVINFKCIFVIRNIEITSLLVSAYDFYSRVVKDR